MSVNESDGEIVVSAEHPEIVRAIAKALEEQSGVEIDVPESIYIRTLQEELERMRKERYKLDSTAPSDGCWILDNFPQTPDQLNAMVASNLVPDTFVVLHDASEAYTTLTQRWYAANKSSVDARIRARLVDEAARRARDEELRR